MKTTEKITSAKSFYNTIFKDDIYAKRVDHGSMLKWVKYLIDTKVNRSAESINILEIGCGRGYLQNLGPKYVGCDISIEASRYLDKPFVCGDALALPFVDNFFDCVMSFTVLEHIPCPETALSEMVRVLRSGGVLIIDAAWRVPPWRPWGLEVKAYEDLPIHKRFIKLIIPLLNYLWRNGILRVPIRFIREIKQLIKRDSLSLQYTSMNPNYGEFLLSDSDAIASIDNHTCALWLYANGLKNENTSSLLSRVMLRCGPLIVVKSFSNI